MLRVCLVVTVNGTTEVIMDGVMTNHELRTSGANPTLVVKGKDLSALMDWIELDGLPVPGDAAGRAGTRGAGQVHPARRASR